MLEPRSLLVDDLGVFRCPLCERGLISPDGHVHAGARIENRFGQVMCGQCALDIDKK